MKIIFKVFYALIILFGISVMILFAYVLYQKPQYEGEVNLGAITSETTVYFDDIGVPHIYANSEIEAMTVLGYVHAQDRLWQMELMRRIAPGRLSEIFGSIMLKNDTFFSGIGISEASAKAIEKVDKSSPSYLLTMAYLKGINEYLDNGKTPVEFSLLGIKKEKFTIQDVYNIFGYMSFSFAMAQKTDPLLTAIRSKFGDNYVKDLGVNGEFNTTKIPVNSNVLDEYTSISKSISALLDVAPIPPFVGSNSWVISPSKTKSGKVLFANDPHIGFSQPATWYEAHIVVPNYEIYGCYLAGTPFPLLGHNRKYAYGLTMFENDDIDFYQETLVKNTNDTYQSPNGNLKFETRSKTIKVKDSSDVHAVFKMSRHGPIVNDLLSNIDTKKPVAMSWIYTQQPLQILEAVYGLSHATSKDNFREAVKLVAAPGLNIMYGDAEGNVAWWATGKLYKHAKAVNSFFILDGASGKDDIVEYLDFSKNPSSENPDSGFVYSANNQPEAVDGVLYPGYYLPEDRAKRIHDLLDKKVKWDREDVSKMIFDNTSSVAPKVVKDLIACLEKSKFSEQELKVLKILSEWDGGSDSNKVAPTIYNSWVYEYLKQTFEDELGPDNFKTFMGTHLSKQLIANQILNKKSAWWDNIATKSIIETREQIVTTAFKKSISNLEKQLGADSKKWTWGRVHTLEHEHPLGKVGLLRNLFNVGIFASPGMNEVINNQFYSLNGSGVYNVTGGPSTRRIIDFSDVENSWSILPTGQSGNPFSRHYEDQAERYVKGKFRKMKMNKEEIIRSSTILKFIPNQ